MAMQSQENSVAKECESCPNRGIGVNHASITEAIETTTAAELALSPSQNHDTPPDGGRWAWLSGQITLDRPAHHQVGNC